jgi:predicted RNase H-like HicB family nuclease
MTYGVIVHRAGKSWNAYVPELDGVVAAASTRERVIELIAEAIPLHLRELAKSGEVAKNHGESEALTLAISV